MVNLLTVVETTADGEKPLKGFNRKEITLKEIALKVMNRSEIVFSEFA